MRNKFLFKYIQLFLLILISGSLIWFSSNIKVHICGMLILCFGAIIISGFDLMHPYFWYSVIFTLYSVSYPILYSAGVSKNYGYSDELMLLQWIALSVFLLVVSPKKVFVINKINSSKFSVFNKLLYKFLYIYICLAIIGISKSNFSTKVEIYSSRNLFYILSFRAALMLTIIYIYQLVQGCTSKKTVDVGLIVKTGVILFLMSMFSGERDIVFRYIAVTIFVLYYFKFIKNRHLLLLVPLFIIIMPLTHKYKYYLLDGTTRMKRVNTNSRIYEFFAGEFVSASSNIQVLLNNKFYTKGLFNGFTFLNTLLRIFFIKTGFGCVSWYNETFFPNYTTNYGFTLVGEGYINWGYLGVAFVFIIIGLFIKYLYKKSSSNIYWFTIYVYTIPIYMYSIRADLLNIFSPFIKHLILSMGTIYLLQLIGNRKK